MTPESMTTARPIDSLDDPRVSPALREMILASTTKYWWWDKTNNGHRGCSKISEGCDNCYCLEAIYNRMSHQIDGAYTDNAGPTFVPRAFNQFAKDPVPKRYFTPSQSDYLHADFPDETVLTFFDAMRAAPQHFYYVLTKRADRLAQIGPYLDWPPNVIAIVSVETERHVSRIEQLLACGAQRVGVSFEPLVGRVALGSPARRDLVRALDFAIIGGETARREKCRRMHGEHAREVRDVCLEEGVPTFFKQWGDINECGEYVGHKRAGRLLDGRTHDELPRGCLDHLVRAPAVAKSEKSRRRNIPA